MHVRHGRWRVTRLTTAAEHGFGSTIYAARPVLWNRRGHAEAVLHIYGGLQDNGVWGFPSRTHDIGGITNSEVYKVFDGDGMHVTVDPTDPNTIYADWHNGNLGEIDLGRREYKDIRPVPRKAAGFSLQLERSHFFFRRTIPKRCISAETAVPSRKSRRTLDRRQPRSHHQRSARSPRWSSNGSDPSYTWDAEAYCTITTSPNRASKRASFGRAPMTEIFSFRATGEKPGRI